MPVACGAHYFLQSRGGKITALKLTYRILKLKPSVRARQSSVAVKRIETEVNPNMADMAFWMSISDPYAAVLDVSFSSFYIFGKQN